MDVQKLRFDVDVKDVEPYNSQFTKARVYICYPDLNRNNSYLPKEAIIDAIPSLYNCPVLGEYNEALDDFMGHGGTVEITSTGIKEVQTTKPYGLIPESSEIKWIQEGGKDYLTATVLLWSSRYPEILQAVEKRNKQSMEIDIIAGHMDTEKKYFVVDKFSFSGLCILGKDFSGKPIEPCFEDAHIEAYTLNKDEFKRQFYEMISELKKSLTEEGGILFHMKTFNTSKDEYGTEPKIEIDNSKEAANMTGSWGDVDKTKLRNDILKKANYKSLVKEAYLIVGDDWEDKPSEELSYPHHEIDGDKLVVHKGGCEAALVRLHGQDITSGPAITHLKKHYRELGMSMENFTKSFKLTHKAKEEEFARELGKKEFIDKDYFGNPVARQKYFYVDHDDDFVYAVDAEDDWKSVKIPYEEKGDNVVLDYDKTERVKWAPVDWEDDEPDDGDAGSISPYAKFVKQFKEEDEKDKEKMAKECEDMAKKVEEKEMALEDAKKEIASLEKDKEEMAKEIDELKEYKDKKIKEEKEFKINSVFAKFKGKLTESEMAPLKDKAMEMSVDTLEEKLFALVGKKIAYSDSNATFGIFSNFSLNDASQIEEHETLWDKYKSQLPRSEGRGL